MKFEFDVFSGLLFFISFGLMFIIVTSRTEQADKVVGKSCSLHPSTKDCVHRRR